MISRNWERRFTASDVMSNSGHVCFLKHPNSGSTIISSLLCNFQYLSRLVLAVAILFIWLASAGTQTIRSGSCYLIDRNDRRDLSIFQIGLCFIERYLTNNLDYKKYHCFLIANSKLSGNMFFRLTYLEFKTRGR
jgi:hypothetical protein